MEKTTDPQFFDFHNHPSGKGALTRHPERNSPWKIIKPFFCSVEKEIPKKEEYSEFEEQVMNLVEISEDPKEPILFSIRQIFDSQSSLTQLKASGTLSIVALIGVEKAFAETFFLNTIIPLFYPLDRRKLRAIRRHQESYFDSFNRDLHQIKAEDNIDLCILKDIGKYDPEKLNVVLSIEGAHSLQSDFQDGNSIPGNLKSLKENPDYRFFHLTLAHLSRQPACTHCYGTKLERNGIDFTRNFGFRPDPNSKGLTILGKDIITEAYNTTPYTLLIDVKHMSLLTRKEFYEYKAGNQSWKDIPIVASHVGVTGLSFNDLKAVSIVPGDKLSSRNDGWTEVTWCPAYSWSDTKFNPWTINLYDEDILEILKSGGLIGLNLDQRILGYGETYPEAMSPEEIPELHITTVTRCEPYKPKNDIDYSKFFNPTIPIPFDFMFQLTEEEMENEKEFLEDKNRLHIDYLACNIIHILKVGLQHGYNGIDEPVNVEDCICIGSDFDGFTDPINFPLAGSDTDNDLKDYVTAEEYPSLKVALLDRFGKCLERDNEMQDYNINVPEFLEKFFVQNGLKFLENHFKPII